MGLGVQTDRVPHPCSELCLVTVGESTGCVGCSARLPRAFREACVGSLFSQALKKKYVRRLYTDSVHQTTHRLLRGSGEEVTLCRSEEAPMRSNQTTK